MSLRLVFAIILSCLTSASLQLAPHSAYADDRPEIEVRLHDGNVSIEAEHSRLTPPQLEALKNGIARQLSATPFRRGGSVELTLKGDRVEELTSRLETMDLNDPAQIDRLVAETWKQTGDEARGILSNNDSTKVIIGQNFTIEEDERLNSVVAIGGSGTIKGTVSTLVAIGSTVDVASTGSVSEDLVSLGSVVRPAPGARINAQEVTIALPSWNSVATSRWGIETRPPSAAEVLLTSLLALIFTIGLAFLFVRFFPKFRLRTEDQLRSNKGVSFGIGILGHVLLIPGAVVLVISLIGILLLPIYFAIYLACMFIGYVTVASIMGKSVVKSRSETDWRPLAVGLVILALIRMVPFFGWAVSGLLATAGLGATLTVFWQMFRERRSLPPRPSLGEGGLAQQGV